MPAVKLSLDVGRHFHSVDHQVADQPVNDGVGHHHPDQTGTSQVALAELSVRQVLVLESSHAGSIHRSTDISVALSQRQALDQDPPTACRPT
jgi:hypothetical protein